jgi:hypothetical protein
MADRKKRGPRYFFTIHPSVRPTPVGEIPGGYRVDLRYGNATAPKSVFTDPGRYKSDWLDPVAAEGLPADLGEPARTLLQQPSYEKIQEARQQPESAALRALRETRTLEWFGIQGAILSGGDWTTVRQDGVVTFDGRLTIRADSSFLVDVVISGVVDLRRPEADALSCSDNEVYSPVYERWLSGELTTPIRTVLSLRFEAARAGQSWADNKIKNASVGFWKYERLVRGHFMAIGQMEVQQAQYSPISDLQLEVYEMGLPQ